MKPEHVRFDDNSAVRVAAIVAVAVVHLVVFVFISLPATPLRRIRTARTPAAGSDLIVRLLEVHVPTESTDGASIHRSFGRFMVTDRHMPVNRKVRRVSHAGGRGNPLLVAKFPVGGAGGPDESSARPVGATGPSHRKHAATKVAPGTEARRNRKKVTGPLDLSLPDTNRVGPVVGRTLGHARSEPHFRLPGGGHVHGAPRIELADPRTQGVAGVLRTIQGLFGVVNPHCVKVDNWRSMTREERLEQYVTQADIQHMADRYGCTPPERHPALPGDPRLPWNHPGH